MRDGPNVRYRGANRPAQFPPSQDATAKGPIPLKKLFIQAIVVSTAMLIIRYIFSGASDLITMASVSDTVGRKFEKIGCSLDYMSGRRKWPDCTPRVCGRSISDNIVSKDDAERLAKIAKKGLSIGGGSGGASVLDLHSGALSMGEKFIDVYKLKGKQLPFKEEDFEHYTHIKNKIHTEISRRFGITATKLYLTYPTFFSRMTAAPPRTIHDEYWHTHVDKETYGSFVYTSLVYLSTYGADFYGGRFVFVGPTANKTVEPKIGRVVFFTSGSENPHYVERVVAGARYALTVSFTCDSELAIKEPSLKSRTAAGSGTSADESPVSASPATAASVSDPDTNAGASPNSGDSLKQTDSR